MDGTSYDFAKGIKSSHVAAWAQELVKMSASNYLIPLSILTAEWVDFSQLTPSMK